MNAEYAVAAHPDPRNQLRQGVCPTCPEGRRKRSWWFDYEWRYRVDLWWAGHLKKWH